MGEKLEIELLKKSLIIKFIINFHSPRKNGLKYLPGCFPFCWVFIVSMSFEITITVGNRTVFNLIWLVKTVKPLLGPSFFKLISHQASVSERNSQLCIYYVYENVFMQMEVVDLLTQVYLWIVVHVCTRGRSCVWSRTFSQTFSLEHSSLRLMKRTLPK